MKTKTCLAILALLFCYSLVSAAYTSPGWSYGWELGVSRGDNAGSAENFGPLVRGHVQLDVFKFLFVRAGIGYTQLHAAGGIYSTKTLMADYRLIFQPTKKYRFAPYLYAGVGASKEMKDNNADIIPQIPFGIGVQTRINPRMVLDISTGYYLSNSDALDGRVRTDNLNRYTDRKQDGFFGLSLGLTFQGVKTEPEPMPAPPVVVVKPTPPPPPPPAPKPVLIPVPTPVPTPITVPKPVEVVPVPVVDLTKLDTDGDGLSDADEINKYKTDPKKADTDGEGLNDNAEVMQYKTNPLNSDTDGENLNDYVEVMQYKTDPLKADTDGEGLNDYIEVMQYKTNPLKPDTDGEGLNDFAEVSQYKTDPLVADTDKGSVDDGTEVKAGQDPLDPKDDVLDLTKGATFSLEGVLFETGKATLLPVSITILEKAYSALAANAAVNVTIIGYTDNVGTDTNNQSLSQRRADAVKTWLVAKGIKAERMKTLGKGETEPRATNDTAAGRTLNRRIEFQVEN